VIPSAAQTNDRYILHTNDALLSALQTAELGRPLALGAAVEDGVQQKQFMPVKEFFTAKASIYTKSWVPSPWQIAGWGLRQLGLTGGESRGEDRLVKGDFVIVANVEVSSAKALQPSAVANIPCSGRGKSSPRPRLLDLDLKHIRNLLTRTIRADLSFRAR
jgi:charged multivesicular body protein 7